MVLGVRVMTTTAVTRDAPHHTAFRAQIEAAFPRECEPTFTLERQVAEARKLMGEARWAQLNAEWDTPIAGREDGGRV